MGEYKQGDVVWRHGTIGAKRDASSHAVVILAENKEESLHGERFYTCALISNRPSGRAGEIPIKDEGGTEAVINLSQIMISGESTFHAPPGCGNPKIGALSPPELARTRASLDALLAPEKNHFGKVVYSVTPSHDGIRGKPNRPYVLVGGIGRGGDAFFAVPVSSSPGPAGNGTPIQDLAAAGLVRDEGEASHLRTAWGGTVSSRTASHPAGRLSDEDGKTLYRQFLSYKKQLISGAVGSTTEIPSEGKTTPGPQRRVPVPSDSRPFPNGLPRPPACVRAAGMRPEPERASL